MRWWLGAALLTVTVTGQCEEYLTPPPVASPITDHMSLRMGWLFGQIQTTARVDAPDGTPGTTFCVECLLHPTNKTYQPSVEVIFRLEERSRLRVDWLDIRRNANAVLDQPIQFGTQLFAAGKDVQSEFDWRQMDITYTYSFLKGEHYELGAGLGLHLIEAEADATVVPRSAQREDFSGAAPFGTLALDGTLRLTKRLSINARGQYFNLNLHSASGMLGDYHADVQWRLQRNFALGAGYEYETVRLQVRDETPSGFVSMVVNGPEAFLRVSF